MLADAVTKAGGCTKWATKTKVSISYVSMLLMGERPITNTIASHLGLREAERHFVRIKP